MKICTYCSLGLPTVDDVAVGKYCVSCTAIGKYTSSDKGFLERVKKVGIVSWPYGANVDPHSRIKLISWAEQNNFVYDENGRQCVQWLLGLPCDHSDDCAWGSGGTKNHGNWYDHVTCWRGINEERYLLSQPYQHIHSEYFDLGILQDNVNVEFTLFEASPWYGHGTCGVLVKGASIIGYGVLYKCYNEWDELLYVGESKTKIERIAAHSIDKWWKEVECVRVEHFSSKEAAKLAEETVIKAEKPRYNIIHNGGLNGD